MASFSELNETNLRRFLVFLGQKYPAFFVLLFLPVTSGGKGVGGATGEKLPGQVGGWRAGEPRLELE